MQKMTVSYYDFDDNNVTEDLYFHINKMELLEFELSHPGGMSAHIQDIVKKQDPLELFRAFKEIVVLAYGIRDEEKKTFVKSPEIRSAFESSPAIDEVVFQLLADETLAAAFINNVVPKDLDKMQSMLDGKSKAKKK